MNSSRKLKLLFLRFQILTLGCSLWLLGGFTDPSIQCRPIVIDGMMCLTSADTQVMAVNAATGYGQTATTKNKVDGTRINFLSEKEKREGWQLLFDGKTTQGWRGAYQKTFPESGWTVIDGALVCDGQGGGEAQTGGDIVTVDEYGNFDLRFEWQLSEGGNSGVKYFVEERLPRPQGSTIGCEYQILDDLKYPGVAEGKIREAQKTAALYDLFPARNTFLKPIGEWNQSRILVRGQHVEHWLNGRKVLSYERDNAAFRAAVAHSKFKDYPGFGEAPKGRILLQEHGHRAAFRNLKIKALN